MRYIKEMWKCLHKILLICKILFEFGRHVYMAVVNQSNFKSQINHEEKKEHIVMHVCMGIHDSSRFRVSFKQIFLIQYGGLNFGLRRLLEGLQHISIVHVAPCTS